ncbi:hypothetical protein Agub_g11899 [Astrephomene gubernaculifera]|uniref:Mitochondrial carrier protein n=1 Tax=Astrephomene gubernaculifera TaxID=47775 RepID=A0AAD3DYU7_9CHLO|nr:hypothetical protein Agub_g11899 [Astrephomene gubernaculifera]
MTNFLKGLNMHTPRHRAQMARVAALATCGCVASVAMQRAARPNVRPRQEAPRKFLMPQPLVDAICGAVGEVSQIILLYPLETIKVRCQSDGISAVAVVSALLRNGWNAQVVRELYAGLGSATALSVVVGAMHWFTFCAAKRTALGVMQRQQQEQQGQGQGQQQQGGQLLDGGRGATSALSCSSSSSSDSSSSSSGVATAHLHVSSGHHMHDEEVRLTAGGSAGEPDGSSGGASPSDVHMLATANMVGATAGAILTALVEGPLELFRHQAQAGIISGNLFKEMGHVVRTQGPMGLYWGFLPYCFESFPYDISELATYSQLRDVYNQAVSRADAATSKLFGRDSKIPTQVWDIAIGAAAGSAATLISMPFDVVKTYMQTHATDAISLSAGAQVMAFLRTGVWMVQARGPGALWVGVLPRLAQQVPSCTICWWAVEACQQALKPYTAAS